LIPGKTFVFRNHKDTSLLIAEIISQCNQDNVFTNAAVCGKVWILTGMLRLLLVQPGQHIDPTRKYSHGRFTSVSKNLEQNTQVLAEIDNWQNNADNRTHRLLIIALVLKISIESSMVVVS
jgi:hypothetical protein